MKFTFKDNIVTFLTTIFIWLIVIFVGVVWALLFSLGWVLIVCVFPLLFLTGLHWFSCLVIGLMCISLGRLLLVWLLGIRYVYRDSYLF